MRLTAYNFRNTPMLDARVAKISADRVQDELGYFYQLQLVWYVKCVSSQDTISRGNSDIL